MAAKKTTAKKAAKKAFSKKPASKKTKSKKIKTHPGNSIPKEIPPPETEETPTDTDCMCKQKRPNGKFFNFKLVQGRWIQASAIPFPTKELCEEVNC
ncbi:MAG: hypothetical protein ABI416_05195 [Ginsengibacter sp.]